MPKASPRRTPSPTETAPQWKNRIVGTAEVAPSALTPSPFNWRTHPKNQANALLGVIREVGFVQDVIVNQRSGTILDGHLRVALALQEAQATIPVKYVNLSENEERLLLTTLDPLAALAGTDTVRLAALLQDVQSGEPAIQQMLSELAQREGIVPADGPGTGMGSEDDVEPQIDRAEELREYWGVEVGQLWACGEHRVICGDCTDKAVIERLMDGHVAALGVTSPPYNQRIDTFQPSGMHREGHWVRKVQRMAYPDNLPEMDYQSQQRKALTLWHDYMAENASLFYNHKNRYRDKEVVSPLAWIPGPFKLRQEIIWSRPGSITQNARMFLPSDERIYWLYRGHDFYFDDTTENKSFSTVWDIPLETNLSHAVAFPIEIPRRCIMACSEYNAIVLEPYCGSGTTLIACENLHRRCFACEIDPGYVAVTLERYRDVTGEQPTLIP